jgi:signal peptidase I
MKRIVKALRAEFFPLAVTLVLVLFARSTLADHYHIPTGSMEYTLLPGDRVVVDKRAYGYRIPFTTIDLVEVDTPQRGEIVVFDSPVDGTRLIKRVAAVAGDVVVLDDGHLRIGSDPLATGAAVEQFGDRTASLNLRDGGGPDIDSIRVPDGMVLLLGDHRGDSLDGRFFGFVPERELLGRATAIYYRRGDGFTWKPL